ncbi:MAG: hypothetical protein HZC01_05180 [Candidatus Kerfeldbacteria bacterium]|nr:hypothetical protein [Candidatus Kerfeldbacteria bacterium]
MFQFLVFDPTAIVNGLPSADNPFSAMFLIFANGGWIVFICLLLWGLWVWRLEHVRIKFEEELDYSLLAIDIPQMNELSPKAVEQIFAHLYAIKKRGNMVERYIEGYQQYSLSLEIVSIEGYIQFLIYTPSKFRDLIEAAMYAQYPDAEITEVEDYVDMLPKPMELENSEWDIWGTEYKMTNKDCYPIRTYPMFEHSLSQRLLDPLASLMEILSRMGPGEHMWLQLLIEPEGNHWREKGLHEINKLIGRKSEKHGVDLMYFPREVGKGLTESFTASFLPTTEMGEAGKKDSHDPPSLMQHLSPEEQEIVSAIGFKISKLGFRSKLRMIYGAPKGKLNKDKGVNAIHGAIFQFNTQNLNGFDVQKKTKTSVDYFKWREIGRKRRVLRAYRKRSIERGYHGYMLNTEELASLWHFPVKDVKVSAVQHVDAKKGQPPISLPVESLVSTQSARPSMAVEEKAPPPSNLPA